MTNNLTHLIDQVGLHRLFRFWVFAQRGTLAEAGTAVGMETKNNIAPSIRRMEKTLGVQLITPGTPLRSPVTLTDHGQRLNQTLTPIFEQLPQAITTALQS